MRNVVLGIKVMETADIYGRSNHHIRKELQSLLL